MEKFKNFNKLWRTSTTSHPDNEPVFNKEVVVEDYNETDEEEEESFFELELVMSSDKENEGMRLSSNEANAGRRVVPVEPELKQQYPHSPISILKSAPKFKVSLFRKHTDLKLKANPKAKVDIEEYNCKSTISTLISQNCSSPVSKPCKPSITKSEEFQSDSSKRFSQDVMHKYLKSKLIKPFHLKVAKRCASVNTSNNKSRMFDLRERSVFTVSSTSSASSAFRVACKQLGKSRSASSVTSSCRRRDESLMVVERDDGGIQSAILHCKRSFNSSRDSSVHSRSSSDSREQEL